MSKHTPEPWRGPIINKLEREPEAIFYAPDVGPNGVGIGGTLRHGDAARIVACVNACEGIEDPSAVPELLSALKDMFQMMDEKILVRNTEHDHKPEWAGLIIGVVTRLKFAHDAIAKAEGRHE